MKTWAIFACAAAGIALTALSGATASANEEYGTLEVSPNVVRPGDAVTIFATCADPEFTVPAPVESGALHPTTITGSKGADGVWGLSGVTTVKEDVKPGRWSAMFSCGPEGNVIVGEFTVEPEKPVVVEPDIALDPQKGVPGAKVDVLVLCGEPVTVTSKALSIGKFRPQSMRDGDVRPWLGALGTVNAVKPGVYPVVMDCGGKEFTADFTVLAKGAPTPAPEPKAQVPVKPKGAANTGSLDTAPADDTNLYVLGGAALAVLGGVGAWAYRKRQRA